MFLLLGNFRASAASWSYKPRNLNTPPMPGASNAASAITNLAYLDPLAINSLLVVLIVSAH